MDGHGTSTCLGEGRSSLATETLAAFWLVLLYCVGQIGNAADCSIVCASLLVIFDFQGSITYLGTFDMYCMEHAT